MMIHWSFLPKRVSTPLLLAIILTFTGARAKAEVLLSEDFSYSDGDLTTVSSGNWVAHINSGSSPIQVSSGEAVITHGSGSREGARENFTNQASGTIYTGFTFSVDNPGAQISGANNQPFIRYEHDYSNVFVVAPSSGGDFSIGISSSASTADSTWASDLVYGTDYRAVVAYNFTTDQSELWLDPASEASTSILGAELDNGDQISDIVFRQLDSANDETVRVDNLIVGTTFNDVVAVPEPSHYGLVSALLLGIVWLKRKERLCCRRNCQN